MASAVPTAAREEGALAPEVANLSVTPHSEPPAAKAELEGRLIGTTEVVPFPVPTPMGVSSQVVKLCSSQSIPASPSIPTVDLRSTGQPGAAIPTWLLLAGRVRAPGPTWFVATRAQYCSIWRKIHGFEGAVRPIMTASHPV